MKRLSSIKLLVLVSAILCTSLSFAATTTPMGATVASSNQSMADTAITTKVKGIFISEKVFGDKDISVTGVSVKTINGVVYLTGTVNTETQASNAVKIAKMVVGVKKVIFELKVKPAV